MLRKVQPISQIYDAEQATDIERVETPNGHVQAEAGDWIFTDKSGDKWVVPQGLYDGCFQMAPPEPPPVDLREHRDKTANLLDARVAGNLMVCMEMSSMDPKVRPSSWAVWRAMLETLTFNATALSWTLRKSAEQEMVEYLGVEGKTLAPSTKEEQ